MVSSRITIWLICLLLFCGSLAAADVITDWNNVALSTIRSAGTNPPIASRALAIMHAAMFDAVNATNLTYSAYHSYQTALPDSSPEAAAAQAARDVLSSIYPSRVASFDAALAASLSAIPDGAPKSNGIALGQATASDIIGWRANDNWNLVVPYTPGTGPGAWQPTPPAFAPALLPNWPMVTPFALATASQFRGTGIPPLDSAEYAASFNETKLLGSATSASRTPYETQTAFFWADGAGTATPPGHWNMIAQSVAQAKGNSLLQNARLFALLNISLADSAISAWDAKYAYSAWRPITAIRLADPGINPLTTPDPTWTPLLTTPNFPEYVSGHSTFSGAAAQVLANFYGTDDVSFTTGSDALPGVTRTYTSFSDAADEAGRSRIYGGIHFEYSNAIGIAAGRDIANLAFADNLQPIPETSTFVLAVMSGLCGLASVGRRWLGRIKELGH